MTDLSTEEAVWWEHLGGDQPATAEGGWHRYWKDTLAHELGGETEVHMGEHRSDVTVFCTVDGARRGLFVELQQTYLSAAKIETREAFYGPQLVWLYDGRLFAHRIHWGKRGFWIKQGPHALATHRRPVFVASPSGQRFLEATAINVVQEHWPNSGTPPIPSGPARVLGRGRAHDRAGFLQRLRTIAGIPT